jgi:8-oxo-dGTP pyrophosphatase MutT (NUDIX family)
VISVPELLEALARHEPADAAEKASLEKLRMLLETRRDPFTRDLPDHVTAGAVVARPAGEEFLLVFHRRLARWLQPGGHVEPEDASVLEAARREAREETGVRRLDAADGARVLDVDVHPVPPRRNRPAHVHYDVRYLFTTPDEPSAGATDEVRDVRWFSYAEARAAGADASLVRVLRKARARLTAASG